MPTEAIDPPGISWLRVSPKYVTVRLVEWAIGNLIAVALLSLPLVFTLAGWWDWVPLWLAITVPAFMLLLAVWRLLLIPRQVRAIGYAERDDDLLIRSGIFFQRTLVVPYGRMQYVDIGVGPGGTRPRPVHAEAAHRLGRHQRGDPRPAVLTRGRGSASSFPPGARHGWPGCDL